MAAPALCPPRSPPPWGGGERRPPLGSRIAGGRGPDSHHRPPAARPPSTACAARRDSRRYGSSTAPGAWCGSSRPRAVCFGLALSRAELGPEARTRLRPTAALPVLRLHGDGTASSPQRRPKVSERLPQTVLHSHALSLLGMLH